MEVGIWYRDGKFIYTLTESGRFRHRKPELENLFSLNIQGVASEEQKIKLATHIHNFLVSSNFLEELNS